MARIKSRKQLKAHVGEPITVKFTFAGEKRTAKGILTKVDSRKFIVDRRIFLSTPFFGDSYTFTFGSKTTAINEIYTD